MSFSLKPPMSEAHLNCVVGTGTVSSCSFAFTKDTAQECLGQGRSVSGRSGVSRAGQERAKGGSGRGRLVRAAGQFKG